MIDHEKKNAKPQKTDKIRSLNYAVDNCQRVGLTEADLGVWAILFRFERDGVTSVSQKQIAEMTGRSVNHIRKIINRLLKRKIITVIQKGDSRSSATRYRMSVVPRMDVFKHQKRIE